jgi:hypothetical protein
MQTAIRRRVVLQLAFPAHDEPVHGGRGTVIRNIVTDAKSRTAFGAGNERVEIPAVPGVQHFREATRAGSEIRRNRRRRQPDVGARRDLKIQIATKYRRSNVQRSICAASLASCRSRYRNTARICGGPSIWRRSPPDVFLTVPTN